MSQEVKQMHDLIETSEIHVFFIALFIGNPNPYMQQLLITLNFLT